MNSYPTLKALVAGSMPFVPVVQPSKNFPATSANTPWVSTASLTEMTFAQEQHQSEVEKFSRPADEVREAFEELHTEWKNDTRMSSNQVTVLMHPAHYKIIGLGPQVLPYIFEDLSNGGGPWFLALESIIHDNPVLPEHKRSAKMIRADWLQWGRDHGYIR